MRIDQLSLPSWKSLVAVVGAGALALAMIAPASAQTNSAPTPQDDTATVAEDTSLDITVLANDTDPDSDTLTVAAVGNPEHGSVIINADDTLKYTPDANYHGTDSFTYAVTDGSAVASATLTITITPVNDAPVAANDTVEVKQDTPKAMDVLANDTDVDGDTLTIVSAATPAHGTTAVADGKVTYTPDAGYVGADAFTYVISDGSLTSAGSVSITVKEQKDHTSDFDAKVQAACTASAGQPGVTALCSIYLGGNLPTWAQHQIGKNILKLAVSTPKNNDQVLAACADATNTAVVQLCAVYSAGNLPGFVQHRIGKLILKIEGQSSTDIRDSDDRHEDKHKSKDRQSFRDFWERMKEQRNAEQESTDKNSDSQSISDSSDDDDDKHKKDRRESFRDFWERMKEHRNAEQQESKDKNSGSQSISDSSDDDHDKDKKDRRGNSDRGDHKSKKHHWGWGRR